MHVLGLGLGLAVLSLTTTLVLEGVVTVTSGVPQGTVLGPLLFLLYINDITCNIQSEIRLFADDCILYRTIRNRTDCSILQEDIDKLFSWAAVWQMQFNSKKCHILSITRQRSKSATTYTLGTEVLSQVDSYPYLGVTVSSDLRWHNHVSCISTKATRTLNFIRRNIHGCSAETKALAYTSLVRPHLEYASSAWDPYLAVDVSQLESVQRRAARFACNDYRHSTSVTGLLQHLHWPLLSTRRTNFRLATFYKAVNNLTAISTSHLQKPVRTTRNSDETTFTTLSTRTNTRKYSFFPRTIVDWNQLTRDQRLNPSLNSFRLALPHQ